MKQEAIALLRNMFGKSGDMVWITDEDWKIQWSRYDSSGIRNLPELLGVPKNLWEDASVQVYLYECFHQVTIHCSKENGCRVIILKKLENSEEIMGEVSVNNAVQSLRLVRKNLARYLNEKHLDEKKDLLDSIERNCLLLYRKPYLIRILNSVRNGMAVKSLFSVQDVIRQIRDNMQEELGIYAETVFSLPEKTVYLIENEEFFRVVVMAGLILCHQERGYIQQAAFSLGVRSTKAELMINLTPDYHRPLDMSRQLDPENFGSYEEEKKVLETFCAMHHGSWRPMSYSEDNRMLSCCCQICFRTDEYHSEITMHSPSIAVSSDYDDVYRIMLSRMYLSEFEEQHDD